MKTKLIYVTTNSREEAERIAETVVTERLAACANIFGGVTSVYRWEDRLCRETEAVLILKTREDRIVRLMERIKDLHSYDCPCIVALPIEQGYAPFLEWLENETC
jgi:periplasmic divalent cation tolerance protein